MLPFHHWGQSARLHSQRCVLSLPKCVYLVLSSGIQAAATLISAKPTYVTIGDAQLPFADELGL